MSTKTTLKRIALVAVSALGFGLLSVAPSKAAADDIMLVTSMAAGTTSPGHVGVAVTNTVTLNIAEAQSVSGDYTAVSVRVTSAPAGSAFATNQTSGSYATGIQASGAAATAKIDITAGTSVDTTIAGTFGAATAATSETNTVSALYTASSSTGTTIPAKISITPDVAGTYTVLVSASTASETAAGAYFVAGDKSTSFTFTVAGAPSSITLTRVNSSTTDLVTDGTAGSIVKVTLKDSAGNATVPATGEAIDFSTDAELVSKTNASGVNQSGTSLGTSDFFAGTAYLRVYSDGVSADTIVTLTLTGSGLVPATVTANTTITVYNGTAAAGTFAINSATGYKANGSDYYANPATASHAFKLTQTAAATAATTYGMLVTDTSGLVTGLPGTTIQLPLVTAIDAKVATASVSAALPDSKSFKVAVGGTEIIITGQTPALDAVDATFSSVVAAPGSTVVLSANVTNQFKKAMADQTVTIVVTGRNATTTTVTRATDTNGNVSYSLKDSGTTAGSSTVKFSIASGTTADDSTIITWGTVAVSTVSVTGGNTTAGVTSATVSTKDISAADGVEAGALAVSAVVKDAAGNALSGVPVVWTLDKSGAAFTSTTATSYTDATGKATANVYGWIAGTYIYTATAGGVAGTGTITFGQTGSGEERTISGSVTGNVITAKVVDRFGNPVPSVTVYASKSGSGYFGTGVTKTSTTTNASGEAEFAFTGEATVTLSTISYDAVAGTFGSGQTSAPKGYSKNATTAAALALLAFTAYTPGTTLVDEEGVGASFDAAGVATVTVSVKATAAEDAANAAADAAAEAIDAANAATDAANLAAEAADAATVAAEEARDAADAATAAVEELSTQVATLMAALRAQITTLANTVAKIAKKVRA